MNVIGYIRVSSDKQDLDKQNHLLPEYAQQHGLLIHEFIEIEISSRKNTQECVLIGYFDTFSKRWPRTRCWTGEPWGWTVRY
jgi:predicted site-specific integrase-resolvase